MSLVLNISPKTDANVEIKTYGFGSMVDEVSIRTPHGETIIGIEDFLVAVEYVLTNTDLWDGDPRNEFLNQIKTLKLVPGFNPQSVRLSR